ncbi:MAG: adenosylmethionine--8-amino-7-oxononanoate transaminase [Candidatus Poribacteria bacterium]|nr:adenosylmethionine--8-amino-7-oxononanoate transaminase [Candidatus Poribacteria bacterium]MDE0505782.1 adenosylmethionine--8-amino-7-oxononanoate transaminase [Candidatus Poribacteria bacterium]
MLDYKTLVDWDRKYLWHPFTQMKEWMEESPVIIERGEGIYLIDVNGNRYIDGVASMWTNVHGHNRREINDSITTQLNMISHSSLLGYANVPAIQLAKRLVEITPHGLNKVFYSDNGATSVEVALKMACQFWRQNGEPRRKVFLHLDAAYHGDTVGAMSVGGIELFHKTFENLLFETRVSPAPYVYRSETGQDSESVRDSCLHEMESILQTCKGEIAAVIIEPLIQGAGGVIVSPRGFLKGAAELARKYNALLILDEVMTGFGRTGRMWACEHEGVVPDILCTAKGLTAGYLPLAATITTDEVFDAFLGDYGDFRTFFHGHTFTGNQLGCVAALANINLFEETNLIDRIQPTIEHFKDRLKEFYTLDHVGDVRVCGLAAGIELVRDRVSKEEYPAADKVGMRVCREALQHGAILRPLINVIVLMPPLQITITELDQLLEIVYNAIKRITEEHLRS